MNEIFNNSLGFIDIYTFVNGMHHFRLQAGINKDTLHALFYLQQAKHSVTPKSLATYFQVSKPRISKVLAPLLEKKYIITQNSIEDKRSYTLHLSPEGELFLKEAMQDLYELHEALINAMGFGEYIQFLELIKKANIIFENKEESHG